jgi:hypothetical protein
MYAFRIPGFHRPCRQLAGLLRGTEASAVLEFSIILPLLVVFVVGIFDFSAAFNQKQKTEQAAQEGAIVAGGQPTSDITIDNPDSLQPVVFAVFKSLADSGVLQLANQGGTCSLSPFPTPQHAGLTWTYTFLGCSGSPPDTNPGCMGDPSDKLWIVINRGWVPPGATPPVPLGTSVTVSYDYHWRFNSAIQLLFPGAGYSAKTCIREVSTVHNQM